MPATKKRVSELDKLIERAATDKERIILRRGRKRAALVPIEDLEAIKWMEEEEERIDIEDAREALAEAREKGTISLKDFKAKHGL